MKYSELADMEFEVYWEQNLHSEDSKTAARLAFLSGVYVGTQYVLDKIQEAINDRPSTSVAR